MTKKPYGYRRKGQGAYTCNSCGEEKPEACFVAKDSGRLKSVCVDCLDPRSPMLKAYGLAPDEYAALLTSQSGACAICQLPERVTGRRLAVDHNHLTGQVRGLLCTRCNTAIGLLGDDARTIRRALHYLS